jgi:hypothetical protein
MQEREPDQPAETHPDQEHGRGKTEEPPSTKTKRRVRGTIVCAALSCVLITFGGLFISFERHKFYGVGMIFAGSVFAAITLRQQLINHGSKITTANAWALSVGSLATGLCLWISFVKSESGTLASATISSTVSTNAAPTRPEWQPPLIPEGATHAYVTMGVTIGRAIAEGTGPNGISLVGGTDSLIIFRLKDRRIYIDATVGSDSERFAVSNLILKGNVPLGYDRNFNSNAFEIVGEDGLPVYQQFYRQPEHVVVQGLFPAGKGRVFVTWDPTVGNPASLDETWTLGFHASNDVARVIRGKRKALFNYPAWKYPGQLAE